MGKYGLANSSFQRGDVSSVLPEADLLMVKDVLMHVPNESVHRFIENSVREVGPRYKAVMVVQNAAPPIAIREYMDIEPGQLLPFDITSSPFSAPFREVFRWQSDELKVVQLYETSVSSAPSQKQ